MRWYGLVGYDLRSGNSNLIFEKVGLHIISQSMENYRPEKSGDVGPENKSRRDFFKKAMALSATLALFPRQGLQILAGERSNPIEGRDKRHEDFIARLKRDNSRADVTLENDGNPDVGRIVNIQQLHDRPEFTEKQREFVAEYQFEILRFLNRQEFEHVFVESLYENLRPQDKEGELITDAVKLAFKDGIPSKPNELQKEMLVELGAAQVYAYFRDSVFLHKTYTPEESRKIDETIEKLGHYSEESFQLMMSRREELATREIELFLSKNRGATVALIFGAFHSFKKYFSDADSPALYSVDYPEVRSRSFSSFTHEDPLAVRSEVTEELLSKIDGNDIDKISGFIYNAKSNPDLQLRAIRKSTQIQDWVIQHISDAKVQMEALPKFELDREKFFRINRESLKEFLLKNAADEEVRKSIEALGL